MIIVLMELNQKNSKLVIKDNYYLNNLPELMSMFKEVADIQTQETLNLPRSEAENHNVVTKPSEINPLLPDSENSKVNVACKNVYDIWNDTKEQKLTQLVFCDLSTPKQIKSKDELFSEDYQFTDMYNDLKKNFYQKI